jgi:hypothetical protein
MKRRALQLLEEGWEMHENANILKHPKLYLDSTRFDSG